MSMSTSPINESDLMRFKLCSQEEFEKVTHHQELAQ